MLAEANNEREALQEQLRKVDRLIEAIKAMDPNADSPTSSESATEYLFRNLQSGATRPRDAILRAMERTPGKLLAPKDVVNRVRELGLYNNDLASGATAYSTALGRLADEEGSPVVRTQDGLYFYEDTHPSILRGRAALAEIDRSITLDAFRKAQEAN